MNTPFNTDFLGPEHRFWWIYWTLCFTWASVSVWAFDLQIKCLQMTT